MLFKKKSQCATECCLAVCPPSSFPVSVTSLWYCRCGQRWECQRGSVQGQWLWSFNQTQQCLSIQHLSLYNISLGEKTDVIQGLMWGTDGCNVNKGLRVMVCSLPVFFHLLPFFSHSVSLLQITVSVEGLPGLGKGEAYSCFFQDTETPASLTNTGVICPTPDASSLPPIGHGDGECLYIWSAIVLHWSTF